MRKSLIAASLLALTVAVAPACATKKFVRSEVGSVDQKVDTLTGTIGEIQGRPAIPDVVDRPMPQTAFPDASPPPPLRSVDLSSTVELPPRATPPPAGSRTSTAGSPRPSPGPSVG